MKSLALFGGTPVRRRPFPAYPIIGSKEKTAVLKVMNKGMLSGFPYDFLGGPTVRTFERKFADYFGLKHGIAVNSGTAALHVAIAAVGVGPGDEVIVPCYTFTATASAVLHHGATPVFVDIDPRSHCVTANLIEAAITPRTKAIIPVHLLGNVAAMDDIMALARRRGLKVIEDNAQSPGAKYKGTWAGAFGDASTFSFVETKNMATGEGGMVLTNQDDVAERCRLVRNHGEVYNAGKPRSYIANILGWNYRMTEIEAAIGIAQLSQFSKWTQQRIKNGNYLTAHLKFPGITPPHFDKKQVRHVYHLYGMSFDERKAGVSRELFAKALKAEGIPCSLGYPHPLYKNPLFQEGKVYSQCKSQNYKKLCLTVAEDLCRWKSLWTPIVRPPATTNDMKDVIRAFEKIFNNIETLKAKSREDAML